MNITAQQFVDVWTQKGGSQEDLSSYCMSAYTLLKQYGSRIYTDQVRDVIEKYDASLMGFVNLLNRVDKCTLSHIAHIKSLVASGSDDSIVVRSSHTDHVQSIANGASIESQEAVGLTVVGQGKVYKRSLDRDIDKLLKYSK